MSTISSFLLLFSIVHAQTTNVPQISKPASPIKAKRGLFTHEDAIIGPPPPPPYYTIPYGSPTPRTVLQPTKFTNVFGFDDITYQQIFNELNGVHYGIPTHMTPPPTPLPSVYNNGYGYINYGTPHDFEVSYVSHDGRIVKQYSVHERHHNDLPDPNTFQPRPVVPSQTVPAHYPPYFSPANINLAQPRTFNTNNRINQNLIPSPTLLNKNHGPVALGSGSLGVVQTPNGDVFLGSGSLGYISHKDHFDGIMAIATRRQKSHPTGPLTFGHALL